MAVQFKSANDQLLNLWNNPLAESHGLPSEFLVKTPLMIKLDAAIVTSYAATSSAVIEEDVWIQWPQEAKVCQASDSMCAHCIIHPTAVLPPR